MARSEGKPQVWIMLSQVHKDLLTELASQRGVSNSQLAGLWVERGLAGAYDAGPDGAITPLDRLTLDEIAAGLDKLSPAARELVAFQQSNESTRTVTE